jgi:hypothetical protein
LRFGSSPSSASAPVLYQITFKTTLSCRSIQPVSSRLNLPFMMSTISSCRQSAQATISIPASTLLSRITPAPNHPHIVSQLLSYYPRYLLVEHCPIVSNPLDLPKAQHNAFTGANFLQIAEFSPQNRSITNPPMNAPGNFPVSIQDKLLDCKAYSHTKILCFHQGARSLGVVSRPELFPCPRVWGDSTQAPSSQMNF